VLPRHLQAGQQRSQVGGIGGERVLRAVPRNLAAGEFLGDHVAVHSLIADRRAKLAGGTAKLVPRGLHGAADDECAVLACPEDRRLIGGGERGDPAGGDTAVRLVGDRETQVAADRSARRLVLGQDVALDSVCAGGRAEEYL